MTANTQSYVRRISPSQLDLWHRCNRRWAFVNRAKRREPGTDAAQAGTETHKVLEDQGPWDKEWTGPDTEKVYPVGQMAALLQAQTPDSVVARERRWEVEIEGLPFVGVTDFYSEEVVGDYKTTGSIKNAKREGHKEDSKNLLIDPQRLFYTALVPTAKRTLWLYGAWDTMTVTPRELVIDREADKPRLHLRVLQPADTMLNIPDDVDPLSLKPNVNDCHLFPKKGGGGGCPFKSECFPPGKLMPVVTNSKESNEAMTSLIERLRAKAAGEGQPIVPAAEPPACGAVNNPGGVIDFPTPEPAAEPKAGEPGSHAEVLATTAPAASTEKPKRTRVKKVAEPDFKAAAVTAAEDAKDAAAEAGNNEQVSKSMFDKSVAPTQQYLIGTLYVDCLPLTKQFDNAFPLINAAAEEVCADMHVPHFGLVDFAKGGPAVAAQLRAHLSGKYIDALYLETRSAEGKAVLHVLTSVARDVVRGVF